MAGERCEGCGFVWDDVGPDEVPSRLATTTAGLIAILTSDGSSLGTRPAAGRWSTLKYCGHVRDVFLTIRERIIAAMVLEDALGSAIHREERVALGFYAADTPSDLVDELAVASRLLGKAIEAIAPVDLDRTFTYSPVTPVRVTIRWAAAQAVHEAEHHLSDIRDDLRRQG